MFSELKKSSWPTIALICFFGFLLGFGGFLFLPQLWPGGIGIGKDESVTTTTVETIEKDKQGKTVKKVTTTTHNDGKTLWDWGSLLGVPLSLVILGYVLQQQQQKRAEKLSKEQQERAEKFAEDQRKIADNETKEEVLQTYFDRLSVLLIDRNLITLSNKSNSSTITLEEQELLDSSLDVIRARTLSILRRFENDAERKTSVIKFLVETEIVGKSKLNLQGATLKEANLSCTNLQGAYLFGTDLEGANLQGADLQGANLSWANLSEANLSRANLAGANLQGSQLSEAKLKEAILYEANLFGATLKEANLEKADLQGAYLFGTDLEGANLQGAYLFMAKLLMAKLLMATLEGTNLEGANLEKADLKDIKWNSKTLWPDKSEFTDAKNIPEELKKELGITP
jgi:uncharacterized protein YjbI with pentapeptide repeats